MPNFYSALSTTPHSIPTIIIRPISTSLTLIHDTYGYGIGSGVVSTFSSLIRQNWRVNTLCATTMLWRVLWLAAVAATVGSPPPTPPDVPHITVLQGATVSPAANGTTGAGGEIFRGFRIPGFLALPLHRKLLVFAEGRSNSCADYGRHDLVIRR